MQVAGLTVPAIQQRVQQAIVQVESQKPKIGLASHASPSDATAEPDLSVGVRLISKERGLVYVMGEVNAPGSYPLTGSETALDAIIAAGGLSDRANEHKIILTRPRVADKPRLILPICYQRVLQLGDVSTNYQLQPGDRIYVPSMTFADDFRHSTGLNGGKSCPHCRDFSDD
jgi:polysaccharide export outer membrane protein